MSIATKNVPLKKYSLTWLVTSFLVSITSQSVYAFTITPSTGFFGLGQGASVRYLQRNIGMDQNWIVETWLDPKSVKEIKRGGTRNFLRKLEESFSSEDGWLFLDASSDLEGRFDIEYYYACAYKKVCGEDLVNPKTRTIYPRNDGGTGAGFQLRYYPGEGDPSPGQSTLHWIQRVMILSGAGFENFIDIGENHVETPFYDATGAANEIYFVDRPYRAISKNIVWDAELYLVEVKDPENAPKTVTIYNGIQWGWKSKAKRRRNACEVSNSNIDNSDGECEVTKKFSDSLSSGTEKDNFYLDGLTPGATFHAWTNNDLPSNQCNPNTYLSGYDDNGKFLGSDDNSSHLGNGFASSVFGTVSSNGTINLSVKAADGGRRGEDEGNYELYVDVYDAEDFPIGTDSEDSNNDGGSGVGDVNLGGSVNNNSIVVGGSGGGGIIVGGSGGGGIIVGGSGGGGVIVGGSGGGGVIFGNPDGGDIEDTPGRTQQNPIFPSSIDSDGWQTFSNVPGCRWY